MQDLILQLKNKPILPQAGFKFIDYWENKAYYQDKYINNLAEKQSKLNNEPLINIAKLGLAGENYYFKKSKELLEIDPDLNISSEIYLRQSVAESLLKIDKFLRKNGYCLYIFSGYRSKKLQQAILNFVNLKQPEKNLANMLANPACHLPHATGAAFDLEVKYLKTNQLIPTKTERGYERHILENKCDLSAIEKEARDNRRLIHHLLTSDIVLDINEVFVAHPFEYWHYSRFEKLAAFFSGQKDYPILYPHVKQEK